VQAAVAEYGCPSSDADPWVLTDLLVEDARES
jgi:hypothetical protein